MFVFSRCSPLNWIKLRARVLLTARHTSALHLVGIELIQITSVATNVIEAILYSTGETAGAALCFYPQHAFARAKACADQKDFFVEAWAAFLPITQRLAHDIAHT